MRWKWGGTVTVLDGKPGYPVTVGPVEATNLATATARLVREFTSGKGKGKRASVWTIRVEKLVPVHKADDEPRKLKKLLSW